MSLDTVDDLHAAEDEIGRLRQILVEIHDSLGILDQHRAACLSDYCRPSCGYLGGGECESEDPDTCGCPCGHEPEESDA